ncbi:MAG: hypothetical protein WCI88_14245, partial [Chloroflexota bacterium]
PDRHGQHDFLRPGAITFLQGLVALNLVPILDTWATNDRVSRICKLFPDLNTFFPSKNRVTRDTRERKIAYWIDQNPDSKANSRLVYSIKNGESKFPPAYGANILVDDGPIPRKGDECHYVDVPSASPDSCRTDVDITDAWVLPALSRVKALIAEYPEGPDISKMFPEDPIDPSKFLQIEKVSQEFSPLHKKLAINAYNATTKSSGEDKMSLDDFEDEQDDIVLWSQAYFILAYDLYLATMENKTSVKRGRISINTDELAKELYEMTVILCNYSEVGESFATTGRGDKESLQPFLLDESGNLPPIEKEHLPAGIHSFFSHFLARHRPKD